MQLDTGKELVKWEIGLKLCLIQQRQRHGKCEEYMSKRKESSKCVQLNLKSRLSKTIHAMSVNQDKTNREYARAQMAGWG